LGDPCPPFLPVPQFNQFEHIDKPLIDSAQTEELPRLWREFDEDCRKWSQWDLEAYAREFRHQ
jgi:phage FluMu gp28-like protein